MTRKIIETVEEYSESGKLVKKTITEKTETYNNLYPSNISVQYPLPAPLNSDPFRYSITTITN